MASPPIGGSSRQNWKKFDPWLLCRSRRGSSGQVRKKKTDLTIRSTLASECAREKKIAREGRGSTLTPAVLVIFLLPTSGPGNRTAFILKKKKATAINSSQDMIPISLSLYPCLSFIIFSILFVLFNVLGRQTADVWTANGSRTIFLFPLEFRQFLDEFWRCDIFHFAWYANVVLSTK